MPSSIVIPKRKQRMSVASSSMESTGWIFGSFGSDEDVDVTKILLERGTRRASLMSASLTKAEHTVVDVGNSESPRLITCVKASQGFDWNQEIFLPTHANRDRPECKRDTVQEIIVTDEEVAHMLPS